MRRRTALITALCALVALVGVTAAIVWGAATHPDAKPTVSGSKAITARQLLGARSRAPSAPRLVTSVI